MNPKEINEEDLRAEVEKEEKIKKYARLKNSKVWKEIVEEIDKDIEKLKTALYKIGGNEVKYSEKDLMILTIKEYEKMKDYPDQMIGGFINNSTTIESELDAYED